MAEQHDLPSNSDDSDEDFKPSEDESLPSEEESDGSVEEPALDAEDQGKATVTKRKKKQTKHRKKIKKTKDDVETESDKEKEEETKKLSAEEEKQKADSLWSDFMKDCAAPAKKPATDTSTKEEKDVTSIPNKTSATEKENKVVVTEIFEFAGEKIKVEKKLPVVPSSARGRGGFPPGRGRGGGGLASIVGQLGKKNKLSTLEKSKLDWDRFKKDEGIEEDLETFNKGKEGYLERQDFLQRTDLRQFEIEKQLRSTSRSNR